MSLRFIYGRAGSGKTKFCLDEIRDNLTTNFIYPIILLVPEQYTFQTEKSLLEIKERDENLRADVLSFKRLAHRVFSEVGGISREYMKQAGKCMLIYKIMQENKRDFKIFTKAVKQDGFIETIADTITELKRYSITPDELKPLIDNDIKEDLKFKIHDISLIYDAFEKGISERYIDPEDDLTILYNKIDSSTLFNGAEFYIDGFSSFTPQQYRIIEKLLKKCKRVNITLTTDHLNGVSDYDMTEVFAPTKICEEKLLKIIQDNNIPYDKPVDLNSDNNPRFEECKEITYLEQHLFAFPYKPYRNEVKSIAIFKSINVYSEVEEIARQIVEIVRDKGGRYRDIVVAGRNIDTYENLIEGIFSEYNIPYFMNSKREVTSNPLVVLIISSIDIYNKRWQYESVFRYLKTGLIDIEKEDINIIENYVLANGIRGKRWLENWEYRAYHGFDINEISEDEKKVIEHINDIRNLITIPLVKLHERLQGKTKVFDICSSIYDFLIDINVPKKMEDIIEGFRKKGNLDIVREYSGVWDIVIDVLDQMVEVMGDDDISIDTFIKLLTVGFSQYRVGIIPPTMDSILVSSVDRMKNHNGKYLFIIGVNDGVFPMVIKEEGILNDSDRILLRDYGIEISEDTRTKTFGEQFLVYTTLTSTCSFLHLSYPIADHEGKSLRPSIIISRIKKLFPAVNEYSNIILENNETEHMKMIATPRDTFNNMIIQIKNEAKEDKVLSIWKDVYRWYAKNDYWKHTLENIIGGLSYTNTVKYLSKEMAQRLYKNNMTFSVSRLESFSRCPFAYFVQYGLRAEERRVYKISAPDIGTFMHNVLSSFSEEIEKKGIAWESITKEDCEEIVSKIVDFLISKIPGFILNSSPRYKYMAERLKRILSNAVFIIAQHIAVSNFKPKGFEVGFGKGCEYPPINIKLSNGSEINLMGRIDRLDTMNSSEDTYIRIVDYKSGNKDFNLSDIYYGLELQLLTYLDAVLEGAKSNKNIKPAAILYFKIDNPIIRAKPDIPDEKIQEEIMKRLKMRGLLLEDIDVIKNMDLSLESGTSNIIPAGITKDEKLNMKVSSCADLQEFEILRHHVKNTIVNLCESMVEGNIEIKPFKKKTDVPCDFCKYSPICAFDNKLEDNKYKIINTLSNEEVLKRLKVSKGGDGNE